MKLTIPLKKPAPALVAAAPTPPPPQPEPVNNVKPKLVLTKPKPKPPTPLTLPVIEPLVFKDLKARECTFCGHIYGNPCDGQTGCPNHDFLVAQAKKA